MKWIIPILFLCAPLYGASINLNVTGGLSGSDKITISSMTANDLTATYGVKAATATIPTLQGPVTFTSSMTITGAGGLSLTYGIASATGTFTSSISIGTASIYPPNAAPRTNVTPSGPGSIIWNSADGQLCIASGTVASSWVQAADGTTACAH